MTDVQLATALKHAGELEERAREQWAQHSIAGDALEREKALAVLRLASPLKRQLEEWVGGRATRALPAAL